MARWWWVRHGPTHQKVFTGWRDVPADLSDLDRIARLAAYLPSDAVVVSSDLIRASATADAIQGTRPRINDAFALRELHFGEWDGKHFNDVSKTHPGLSRAYWETPGDVTAPGGESWNDTAARVSAFVDQLSAQQDGDIIAVAHFGVILTQLGRVLGQSPAKVIAQKIDNLSVTCLTYGETPGAEVVNHCP